MSSQLLDDLDRALPNSRLLGIGFVGPAAEALLRGLPADRQQLADLLPGMTGMARIGHECPDGLLDDAIRDVRRVRLGLTRGKGGVWGTANPRYWASLDPRRAAKDTGLVLDLGRLVRPFITPDDPDAVEACIRAHTEVAAADAVPAPGPIV